jgi:hypothetical protein
MNPDKKLEHAKNILQTQSEVTQEEYILRLEEQVDSLEKEVCFCGSLDAFGDTVEKLKSFLSDLEYSFRGLRSAEDEGHNIDTELSTFTAIRDLILESIEFIKEQQQ